MYNVNYDIYAGNGYFIVDGVEYKGTPLISYDNKDRTLKIGGLTSQFPGRANVRVFEIFESNVMLHKYIPCYRKKDNINGMYDFITKSFIESSGTVNSSVGEDVN